MCSTSVPSRIACIIMPGIVTRPIALTREKDNGRRISRKV